MQIRWRFAQQFHWDWVEVYLKPVSCDLIGWLQLVSNKRCEHRVITDQVDIGRQAALITSITAAAAAAAAATRQHHSLQLTALSSPE